MRQIVGSERAAEWTGGTAGGRAEATRGKIINAAVELFTDAGYGDTDLAAIVRQAGITKGAFYYHFESREQVAHAIIAEGNVRLRKVFFDADKSSSSALQNLILATFGVARLIRTRHAGGDRKPADPIVEPDRPGQPRAVSGLGPGVHRLPEKCCSTRRFER